MDFTIAKSFWVLINGYLNSVLRAVLEDAHLLLLLCIKEELAALECCGQSEMGLR